MNNSLTTPTRLNAWLRCPFPNPTARLRLICFPYAGGGAGVYRTWGQRLSPEIEVCAVQLPGREDRLRESAFTDMNALVPILATFLKPYLDKPFAFFGHSMGAWISFALSHHLRQVYRQEPTHLFVSGRRAPHLASKQAPLHLLSDQDFLQQMQQRYGGIPDIIWQDQELRALYLPLLKADLTLVDTYSYRSSESLTCPLTACGGASDFNIQEDELLDWQQHSQGDFAMQMFAGDHFYLNQQPEKLLQFVEKRLLEG